MKFKTKVIAGLFIVLFALAPIVHAFFLEDGKGGGKSLHINTLNRAATEATTHTLAHDLNHRDGKYFTLTINATATAANDCIGYIKNTDDADLILDTIYLYSATATVISIYLNDAGTPASPTTITAVNCNGGSGNTADITSYEGVELDAAGVLSGGDMALNWDCAAGIGKLLDFHPTLIVPKNSTLTFYTNQNANPTIIGLGFGFTSVHND